MTEIQQNINPFRETVVIEPKKVRMTAIDEDRSIVNKKTNEQKEVFYNYHVTQDDGNFAKIYLQNIDLIAELSPFGIKLFLFICKNLRNNNDVVFIKSIHFMEWSKYKNRTSYYDALKELIEKEFIYPTEQKNFYYINYGAFFNGNRLHIKSEFVKK